jgi:hypothetical protein
MSCEKYKTKNIPSEECIGDSLEKINDNFFVLRNAYCDIRTELNNRLRIMNQSVPLPEYTETIVFSGTRVSVRVTPGDDPYDLTDNLLDNGVHKTVFIPVTGVTQILAGSNITLESTQPGGRGEVTVNFDLPPRAKQIRTFMFYEDGNNNALTRPSYTRLQNFINNNLKVGPNQNLPVTTNSETTDISRENDEIYIVYFKTARNRATIAAGGSQAYTGYKGQLVSGPTFGGGEPGRPSSQSITSKGEKSYTATWPSDTADRSALVTITYKFRFTGTEYVPIINDETGAWPKYSYSLHQSPDFPGLAIQPPPDTITSTPDATEVVVRFYGIPAEPFVVPANVTSIQLLVIGAGGGGGKPLTPGQTDKACGGGGSGGYYFNPSFTVKPGGIYSVEVGVGGTSGTNSPSQNGGYSTFALAPGTTGWTSADRVYCRGGGSGANGSGQNSGDGASSGGGPGTHGGQGGTVGSALTNPSGWGQPIGAQGRVGGVGSAGRGGGGGGYLEAGKTGSDSTNPGVGGAGIQVPAESLLLTGQWVCAGGSGGVDTTVPGAASFTQRPDLRDSSIYGLTFKYGCGGGAGLDGSNGLVGVAYRQSL